MATYRSVSMAERVVIVDTPAIAGRGETLFPGAVTLYANGVLPADALAYQDAVVVSTDRARIEAFCNAFLAANCPYVREWEIDLSSITERAQIEALAKKGALKPYSAPQVNPTASAVPPATVAEPAGAEPDDDYREPPDEDERAELLRHEMRMASNVVHLRAVTARAAPDDWPEPVNFWTASKLPPFDESWILPTVRPFVLNQAAMVGCDPGITWLQAIAFAAGCLSDDIRVRVRPLQDWAESARIWACIIGDSGDGKSPSMRGIMRESRDLNVEIAERSKLRQAAYKDELDLYELERKEWLARRQKMDPAKPAGPRPVPPPKPVNEMLYFNDTTSEGLNDQQEATTRGAMCYSDEFLGWLLGMDQYKAGGKGSDRQFWLSSWDGAEYVGIRAGKLRTIPNTGVTIIGGSQPGAIRIASQKLNLDTDGLLQRVLVYNSQGDASEGAEQPADREALRRWRDILHRLYAMKTHLDHCVFSDKAHAIRKESNEWVAAMRSITSFPMAARQALSKWRAYLPRIALTLHAIEAADKGCEVIPATIEEHTVACAWRYMQECLWPHLLHFYATLTDNTEDRQHLVAFANYVLARELPEVRPAYLSSKWTHYQRKIKTIQQRREFWDSVVQSGWARPQGGFDRTGQIAAVYTINPGVFDGRFDAQTEVAKAQIERYRELMREDFRPGRRAPGED